MEMINCSVCGEPHESVKVGGFTYAACPRVPNGYALAQSECGSCGGLANGKSMDDAVAHGAAMFAPAESVPRIAVGMRVRYIDEESGSYGRTATIKEIRGGDCDVEWDDVGWGGAPLKYFEPIDPAPPAYTLQEHASVNEANANATALGVAPAPPSAHKCVWEIAGASHTPAVGWVRHERCECGLRRAIPIPPDDPATHAELNTLVRAELGDEEPGAREAISSFAAMLDDESLMFGVNPTYEATYPKWDGTPAKPLTYEKFCIAVDRALDGDNLNYRERRKARRDHLKSGAALADVHMHAERGRQLIDDAKQRELSALAIYVDGVRVEKVTRYSIELGIVESDQGSWMGLELPPKKHRGRVEVVHSDGRVER